LFVVLAFSGGGTRAAAFSYGVLRQLRDITFHVNPDTGEPVECSPADSAECRKIARSLLDEVDVISSVSGGSFTSAYYALNGHEVFDENSPFHREFLYHPVQRDLFATAVYHPQNWNKLRSRVEIAANLYAAHIFGNSTFAELKSRPRPYLIVNATDMSTGARFEFTQEQFDLLCADLDPVPIARAVAASSAFPGLLNSMTIDSFNTNATDGGCSYDGPGSHTEEQAAKLPPLQRDWVDRARSSDRRTDRYYAAEQVLAYKNPARRHLHLLDGGLADNIGARALIQGIGTLDRPVKRTVGGPEILGGWSALSLMNQRRTRTVLVVIVNARTSRDNDWDTKPAGPGTADVIGVASGVPMGNFSRETLVRVRELLGETFPKLNEPGAPALFGLEVAFQELPDAERRFFSNLGTNFNLDRYEVDCLIDRGASLLRTARFIEPSGITFTEFAKDTLRGATIGVPAGSTPACTPEAAAQNVGARTHYIDVGLQLGATFGGSDDIRRSRIAPGVVFRATRPHGWGVVVDIGPQSFEIAGDVDSQRVFLGDLRLWSFMGGVARSGIFGRSEIAVGVSAGYGFAGFDPSLESRDFYGQRGLFGLEGDASNAWLVKPQASLWYNLSDRWAATVSASYITGRSTVSLASGGAVPFSKRVDASTFRIGVGLGFKIL
jgi:NTE family protein